MRTTLTIDDDILEAARSMARRQGKSVGDIVSELARRSLTATPPFRRSAHGIPLLPVTNPNAVVTLEHVNALRDDES